MYLILPLSLLIALGDPQAARPDPPSQSAASVLVDERNRLSAEQLVTYFPEQIGPFRPVPDSYRAEEIIDLEDSNRVMSVAIVDYKSPFNTSSGSGSFDVRIRVDDWIDWPTLADNMAAGFDRLGEGTTEQWDGTLTQTRLDDGTLVLVKVKDGDFGEVKRETLIESRFKVTMTAKPSSELDLDTLETLLVSTYESSRLPQLADAPVYSEAKPVPGLPSWLGGEADSSTLPAPISCDELLPVAEVERICDVSGVRAIDTGMASEGDCNRMYKRGDAIAGFVFLLTRHGQANVARRALAVASEDNSESEAQRLPDLADGGYSFESGIGEARVAFTADDALIELRASDNAMDAVDEKLCLERDEVEAVARVVADRLSN